MASILTSTFSSIQMMLSWAPHFTDRAPPAHTLQISPSDLLESMPNSARDFRINPLCAVVSEEADTWAVECIGLSPSRLRKENAMETTRSQDKGEDEEVETLDLKTGLLASLCFTKADPLQLRLCSKFIAWVWLLQYHLENFNREEGRSCIEENIRLTENEPGSTEITSPGFARGLQIFLRQLERSPESHYTYDRFRLAVHGHLQLLSERFEDPSNYKTSRSSKEYIAQQRQAGWHSPLFILIEYAYGLKSLSEEPQSQSIKRLMAGTRNAAAEVITYALDIYACAGALSQDKPQSLLNHNVVKLLAQDQSLSILSAVARAKEFCSDRLRTLSDLQDQLLRESSSPKSHQRDSILTAPTDIAIYAQALGDCVRGVIYWAFESELFFGQSGGQATLVVDSSGDGSGMDL